jgi:hypothetical protein
VARLLISELKKEKPKPLMGNCNNNVTKRKAQPNKHPHNTNINYVPLPRFKGVKLP